MKEVTFRTPVILGNSHIASRYDKDKIKYRKGDILHENSIPLVCESLHNGMIIDLPVENIEEYVNEFLRWLPLKRVEVLIDLLQTYLHSQKQRGPQNDVHIKDIDIMSTPFFQALDRSTQSKILGGLEVLKRKHPKSIDDYRDEFKGLSPID